MAIAVLRFPGTNNEEDILRALSLIPNASPYLVPSREGAEGLKDADGVVIPGGFSYGDYLRAGAVASIADIMEGVRDIVDGGKPVLGICNGFQILAEAGFLPGALLPNSSSRFICKWIYLHVSDHPTTFTKGMENAVIRIPIAHAEGNFYAANEDLDIIVQGQRVPFRYCNSEGVTTPESNPNGSVQNIAGVVNEKGNVLGMMPHPERASRTVLGSTDGIRILENLVLASREK